MANKRGEGTVSMKYVRIKDVAEHAQVSVATITRVINNPESVSDVRRERVLRSIDKLGYIPNRMAGALKNRNTRLIGIAMPIRGINPYFTNVGDAISRYAQHHGYSVLSVITSSDAQIEISQINNLIGRMVEGIVFIGNMESEPENIQKILNKRIPVIMVERPMDIHGIDKVLINDFEGSSIAAQHFLSNGHKRVGFIGVEKLATLRRVEEGRYEGFRRTMARHGAELLAGDRIFADIYDITHGYNAMKQIFKGYSRSKDMPTGFFIASDVLACGVMQYLYEIGLRVPGDVSIIGYDNTLSAVCSPPISSIAFPFDEIGKTVIQLFLEHREDNRAYGKSVELSPFYEDRHTVRDLRK